VSGGGGWGVFKELTHCLLDFGSLVGEWVVGFMKLLWATGGGCSVKLFYVVLVDLLKGGTKEYTICWGRWVPPKKQNLEGQYYLGLAHINPTPR